MHRQNKRDENKADAFYATRQGLVERLRSALYFSEGALSATAASWARAGARSAAVAVWHCQPPSKRQTIASADVPLADSTTQSVKNVSPSRAAWQTSLGSWHKPCGQLSAKCSRRLPPAEKTLTQSVEPRTMSVDAPAATCARTGAVRARSARPWLCCVVSHYPINQRRQTVLLQTYRCRCPQARRSARPRRQPHPRRTPWRGGSSQPVDSCQKNVQGHCRPLKRHSPTQSIPRRCPRGRGWGYRLPAPTKRRKGEGCRGGRHRRAC